MTIAGSSRNYKVGPKNNWRRTIWNEVLSRTHGREKTDPILYLAGPQDLDRAIAIEKGVPAQNMVAIDYSADNVRRVRSQQAPAIAADIHDVLRSWPESRPVCAVILDFCCGLTTEAIDVYDIFERPPLRGAVVMVNFMRGRDAFTNAIRLALTASASDNDDPDAWPVPPCYMVGGEETFHLSEKHRALQFLVLHAIETWQVLEKHGGWRDAMRATGIECDADGALAAGYSLEQQEDYASTLWFVWANRIFQAMRPRLFSYKSGALTFDSAVFQPISRGLERAPAWVQDAACKELEGKFIPDRGTARKISAMLAVRTMRQ